MKRLILTAGAVLIAFAAHPAKAGAQETQAAIQDATTARASLLDASGKKVGTATLSAQPNGVLIELKVQGLPQGTHAFHLHEKGACRTPDFESAGGHFNPTDRKHGMEVGGGPHAGDLPNIHVDASGKAELSALDPYVTLGKGNTSLLAGDGAAVVIHAGRDDYTSQPSGNAGNRIACGKIERG